MKNLTEAKERIQRIEKVLNNCKSCQVKLINCPTHKELWGEHNGMLSMKEAVEGEIDKAESVCFGEAGEFNPITKEYIPCTDCISKADLKQKLKEVKGK